MSESTIPEQASPPQDNFGGSPGTILRRCREYHGISLDEASETTKIGVSHLKALEDDQIREFANQAYLKGFLRIYATYLGLNSEDIARMYDKLFGVKGEKLEPARSTSTSTPSGRHWISLKKIAFPALLLVVILITATFFKRPPTPPVRQSQPAAVVPPAVQNPAVQMVQSSVQTKKAVQETTPPKTEQHVVKPSVPEKMVTTKQEVDIAKGLFLRIKVIQNGTLTTTVDGSGPQQYELTSGDIIEWKAEKKITLELSNAGGVDIELNGKPYPALGPQGKQAYVELDADGIKP